MVGKEAMRSNYIFLYIEWNFLKYSVNYRVYKDLAYISLRVTDFYELKHGKP